VKPPDTLTDGVVVLRQLQEGDRAVVLSTMRDPLVQRWLNMPREPSDRDFDALLQTVREGWRSGDRFDYLVVENGDDVSLGAVIASRRHRDNYEIAYLARAAGRAGGKARSGVRKTLHIIRPGAYRSDTGTHIKST